MSAAAQRPVALVVLDGWGHRPQREGNAIALAETPTWDAIWRGDGRTLLQASGRAVGLPAGQMGNSEVGHLNLGAGRVVKQDLVRIDEAIESGDFFRNPAFVEACRLVKERDGTLHLMGLIGQGGVHASQAHLKALVDLAEREGVRRVAIHALLDGRDTLPTSALGFMRDLLAHTRDRAVVASLGGRYFGMDRDKRWDRTRRWYDAAVLGEGPQVGDPLAAIEAAYERGETDEFIPPVVVARDGLAVAPMRDGDALILFNFRSDRMRQIVRALSDAGFDGFDVSRRPRLHLVTMTQYDPTFDVTIAFAPQSMARIVAEVLEAHGRTSLRTAETEKYPHVTYFFNGGREVPFKGEERELVPSRRDCATYDLCPEMSAAGITDVLVRALARRSHDFILCNYANGDMVGHSGSLPATIQAVEMVDRCLARVVTAARDAGVRLLVTADHGNCEQMIDPETGGPHTAHTSNPVPLVVLDPDGERPLRAGGALCDVGPTILSMLGIERPAEMTGVDLRTLDPVK
ncbi:MAG TPA: 2,3-bisphosphoglycerate-independent phosphoglycerate mutase [Gemmatimonadaceae bacterium]|nr:2,3-bisphosphoglycerate-independent phosphoglycerate mutase [Gemmatimonadaceae bacterium]